MLFLASVAWALPDSRSTQQLLSEIDEAIQQKTEIRQQRIHRADSLQRLAKGLSGAERINALFTLYSIYESFQADSTLSVLDQIERMPECQDDSLMCAYVKISRARTYGVMGLYANAYECLQQVRPQTLDDRGRLNFFNASHAVYGWMSDFSEHSQPELSSYLRRTAATFHDSILSLEPDVNNRIIVRTNKMYDEKQYRACIDTLLFYLDNWTPGQQVYAYSRLAQAYEQLGESANATRYLALTALGDLQAGNTEYMALPILAQYLFAEGDNERSYSYLLCSLEDATFCNAGLRTIESSAVFPIFDRARQANEHQMRKVSNWVFGGLLVLSLILIGGIVRLFQQRHRLQRTQKALSEANNRLKLGNIQLQNANQKLQGTDKMKEEYFMQYLARSRRYLSAMESFQRQVQRILQSRQMEDVSKQLKSTQLIADEQSHFYADFDEAFLKLYPNFINDFNALLIPEARIIPKRGELLTTELRIFALIRLGETDSNQIAKFLGYSLTTIYNYRSRVRINAIGDKDRFEDKVMAL